jgi:D-alanyl-D-alanine carboxypeptidase/D-alanyl-D-alanine-endopeptidase (penicillin-binding protein 4)
MIRLLLIISLFITTAYSQELVIKSKINPQDFAYSIKNISTDESWSKDANKSFNFASVNKLITATIALDKLGPDFKFRTLFFSTKQIKDNKIIEDLIIRGEGDPTLSIENLKDIFNRFKAKGIDQITGNIFLDDSYFKNQLNPKYIDDLSYRAYNIQPKSLLIEAGAIEIQFLNQDNNVSLYHKPSMEGIKVVNNLKITNKACEDWKSKIRPEVIFADELIQVTVNGSFSKKCKNKSLYLNALNQDGYLKAAIINILNEAKIVFEGEIEQQSFSDDELKSYVLLDEHFSDPLNQLMYQMNKYSLNLFSRNLALVAMKYKTEFDADEFNTDIFFKSWFEKKGINANEFFIENGAGLSRDSYANSLLFQEILAFIIASDWKSEIISSLPITGIDGTLKSMFKEKSFSNATHLKTGRLKNVFALSGFMKSSKGEEYIVTFVLNGPQYESFLKFIEQSLEYLYQH